MKRSVQLQHYLDSVTGRSFNWNDANCCHFSSDWVELVTGMNPMDGLRVTTSAIDAHRLIASLGGLRAATTAQLGIEPIDAKFAQIGDVVLVEAGSVASMGICAGTNVLLINSDGQMSRVDLINATCAWRLP